MNYRANPGLSLVIWSTWILAVTGCQSGRDFFSLDAPMPWEREDEEQPMVPDRIACAWTETVMTRPGQAPQRGFGGRLHFYGAAGSDPLPVAGQLVVYAFDETDRDPTDNRPTKRYVFPPEQFARHRSDSSVGPSYSFWLPWSAEDGMTRDISLICRFEPAAGPLVVSEQTRHRLQGTMLAQRNSTPSTRPATSAAASPRPTGVTQTALTSSNNSSNNVSLATGTDELPGHQPVRQPRMKTTSISLPSSFRSK